MQEIPKDLAERIYGQYEITLTSPVDFDELYQIEKREGAKDAILIKDVVRHTYEKGIVKPEGQLFWLHQLHSKAANFKEPYDVGFFNALTFCMLIFSSKEPEYVPKPRSLAGKERAARKRLAELRKKHAGEFVELEEKHAEEIKSTVEVNAEEIKANAKEIKELKDGIKELKKAG